MKKIYKIGEVGKIYGISTDILRYYEKIGLLIPEIRKENGYRYYSEKQLWKLNNIRNLRKLEVGLKEITEFLNVRSISTTEKMIDFQLEKINHQIKQLRDIQRDLKNKKEEILFFKNFNKYEIPLEVELEERYIYLTKGSFKEESEINLEMKKLKDRIEEEYDFLFTKNEIGVLIDKTQWNRGEYYNYNGIFVRTFQKSKYILPKGKYLIYYFKGGYEEMDRHYKKIKLYLKNKGYKVIEDIIELYHIEMHITENKEEYVTEIQILLEKI